MKIQILTLNKQFVVIDSSVDFQLVANPIVSYIQGVPQFPEDGNLRGTDYCSRRAGAWQIDAWKLLSKKDFPLRPVFTLALVYDDSDNPSISVQYSDINLGEGLAGLNGQLVTIDPRDFSPIVSSLSAQTADLQSSLSAQTTDLQSSLSAQTADLQSSLSAQTTDLQSSLSVQTADLQSSLSVQTTDLQSSLSAQTANLRSTSLQYLSVNFTPRESGTWTPPFPCILLPFETSFSSLPFSFSFSSGSFTVRRSNSYFNVLSLGWTVGSTTGYVPVTLSLIFKLY